jgi:hypothetical protein
MKIITALLAALSPKRSDDEPASSLDLFDAADAGLVVPAYREQTVIVVGSPRSQRRGAMLRDAARPNAQQTVTVAACGSCGTAGKVQDGIVIAQCGCGGGMAQSMMVDSSAPGGNGGGFGSYGLGGGGNLVANPPGVTPPCDPWAGCYPRSICDMRTMRFKSNSWAEMLRASRMARQPYQDPYYDSIWMDTILSPITTVAAGVTVDIPLQPTAGTFALFYYEIIAVDPTTQVQQVDWRSRRPRIEGCPVPCSTGDQDELAQLTMKVPESCCGIPLVAWVDEESRNTPLLTSVTNNQAAGDLLFQVKGRGYCCNERIC